MDDTERRKLFEAYKSDALHTFQQLITQQGWEEILYETKLKYKHPEALSYLKQIYNASNYAATNVQLGILNNQSSSISHGVIMGWIRHFVVKQYSDLMSDMCIRVDGSHCYWGIPFWGKYVNSRKHFEWKLKPELAKAMEHVFPELLEDEELSYQEKVLMFTFWDSVERKELLAQKDRPQQKVTIKKIYKREAKEARLAHEFSGFQCEIDKSHKSFTRNNDENYVEAHHLVPFKVQDKFDVNIDRVNNIVSLCPNCHKEIHYGKEREVLIRKLYDLRRAGLKNIGVDLTLEQIISYY